RDRGVVDFGAGGRHVAGNTAIGLLLSSDRFGQATAVVGMAAETTLPVGSRSLLWCRPGVRVVAGGAPQSLFAGAGAPTPAGVHLRHGTHELRIGLVSLRLHKIDQELLQRQP